MGRLIASHVHNEQFKLFQEACEKTWWQYVLTDIEGDIDFSLESTAVEKK